MDDHGRREKSDAAIRRHTAAIVDGACVCVFYTCTFITKAMMEKIRGGKQTPPALHGLSGRSPRAHPMDAHPYSIAILDPRRREQRQSSSLTRRMARHASIFPFRHTSAFPPLSFACPSLSIGASSWQTSAAGRSSRTSTTERLRLLAHLNVCTRRRRGQGKKLVALLPIARCTASSSHRDLRFFPVDLLGGILMHVMYRDGPALETRVAIGLQARSDASLRQQHIRKKEEEEKKGARSPNTLPAALHQR